MNKTVQDLELEIESIFKNPQFKEIWNEKLKLEPEHQRQASPTDYER